MPRLRSAASLVRERGIGGLLERVRERHSPRVRSHYYRLKAGLGLSKVSVSGVTVDVGTSTLSDMMVHRLRTGRYEPAETELIRSHLVPTHPVIDLGAGIGYTATLADRHTERGVPTVAVEANPHLEGALRRTRELNGAAFDIVNAAYGVGSERIEISIATDFWSSSRYDRDKEIKEPARVPAVSLAELLDLIGGNRFQLLVDVEGSEFDLLADEMSLLSAGCSRLIVEFHDFTPHDTEAYRATLAAHGFEPVESIADVTAYANERFG